MINGQGVPDGVTNALSRFWCGLVKRIRDTPIPPWAADRRAARRQVCESFFAELQERYSWVATHMRGWLGRTKDGDLSLPEPSDEIDPIGPMMTAGDFCSHPIEPDWLVKGLLVRYASTVIGGPSKSLKTTMLIALMIAMASGLPFLGLWPVPRRLRVCLISAEDDAATLQATFMQICRAMDVNPADLDFHLGFKLPNFNRPDDLDWLGRHIDRHSIDVIALDPLYLAIAPIGKKKINPNDMFAMGQVLTGLNETCQQAGATPLLVHHTTKDRAVRYGPPDLSDLAHSGIGQFARQWILLGRRGRFVPGSDSHALHCVHGGSAGHSGAYHIDIDTGMLPTGEGRRWAVSISDPANEATAKGAKSADGDEREQAEVLKLLEGRPDHKATARQIRTETGWNKDKADRIIAKLLKAGRLRECEVQAAAKGGGSRAYPGFEPTGSQGGDEEES
jgi:hypothetical protein